MAAAVLVLNLYAHMILFRSRQMEKTFSCHFCYILDNQSTSLWPPLLHPAQDMDH